MRSRFCQTVRASRPRATAMSAAFNRRERADGFGLVMDRCGVPGCEGPGSGQSRSERPLGRGDAVAPRVDLAGLPERPGEPLEDRLADVVRVAAVVQDDVEV